MAKSLGVESGSDPSKNRFFFCPRELYSAVIVGYKRDPTTGRYDR